MSTLPSPPEILAHSEWVHRLARQLVRDPHVAADLAQAACVQALERRPREVANPRGWLARVLRNLWLQHERRRDCADRSLAAAAAADGGGDRHAPAAVEVVERAQHQAAVLDAVLALDEPYRDVVLLRFFEDLPPRAIAARLDVPVNTVRTRLQRGLDRLRARLRPTASSTDGDAGDARAFLAAIAVLSDPASLTTGSWLAATGAAATTVMKIAKPVTWTAAALVAGVAVSIPFWTEDTAPRPEAVEAAHAPTAVDVELDDVAPDVAREAVPAAASGPSAGTEPKPRTAPEPVPMLRLTGAVIDVGARPVGGVELDLGGRDEQGLEPVVSSSDGAFAVDVPNGERVVAVADRGRSAPWATVLGWRVTGTNLAAGVPAVVVAAPRIDLGGTVVGADGRPLAAARVTCRLPSGFASRFPRALDSAWRPTWTTRTDRNGRFSLAALGRVEGAVVRVEHDGYLPAQIDQPAASRDDLTIALSEPDLDDGALAGIVVDAAGDPVGGAVVALGSTQTESAADGSFTLVWSEAPGFRRLVAIARGHQPATVRLPTTEGDEPMPRWVRLQLGDRPLTITGRVVDADGNAREGVRVWVNDPLSVGRIGGGWSSAEGYLCGGLTRGELEARYFVDGRPTVDLGEVLDTTPTSAWGWVRTAADGSFELPGLLARDYGVSAMLDGSLLRTDVGPIAAGSRGVSITLPTRQVHARVAGRVVSRSGHGLAGISVRAMCDPQRLDLETGGASTMHAMGASTTTDARGAFELEDVASGRVYLRLDGEAILPLEYGRDVDGFIHVQPGRSVEELRIEVAQRVHVLVELAESTDDARQIGMLDANGDVVPLNVFSAYGRRTTRRVPVHAETGRTDTLSVSDAVTHVVLFDGDDEVKRLAISLVPGDVQVVRL